MPSVGIDLKLVVRQALCQIERVGRWHHAVVIAVRDEDWLLDGGQVGRLLHTLGATHAFLEFAFDLALTPPLQQGAPISEAHWRKRAYHKKTQVVQKEEHY